MKLKIEKIFTKEINTKKGPGVKLGVLHQGNWYTTFLNNESKQWKVGDEIDVDFDEVEYKGKTYYNIKNINKVDRIREVLDKLDTLNDLLRSVLQHGYPSKEEIEQDDLPF